MANLTPAARVELRNAVRNYLERVPNTNSADKHETTSSQCNSLVSFMSRTFCTSARPLNEEFYRLNILDLSNQHQGSYVDVGAVNGFALTPPHAQSVQQTLNRRRGISVVYMTVIPVVQHPRTHACILVFDARTRKQHFFNPWGYTNHWMSRAFRHRPNPIVEGFEAASLNEDAWPTSQQSLQTIVDNNHYDVNGNCALYCILVGVLCTRFGLGQPRLMGDLIVEALQDIDTYSGLNVQQGVNHVGSHMSKLWNWMIDMTEFSKIIALPRLHPNSTVTADMVRNRVKGRDKANRILAQYPPLPGPPLNTQARVTRRAKLRQTQINYLATHPVLYAGQFVTDAAIAERTASKREAEQKLLRMMFPPAMSCDVVLKSGRLCSRRACVGQPLCWQHKFLTRNHRLTGPGRMRCAAVQHPC